MWKLQQKSRGIRISKQKKEGGGGQACSTDPWQIASAAILIHGSRARHFPKGHLKKKENEHHEHTQISITVLHC